MSRISKLLLSAASTVCLWLGAFQPAIADQEIPNGKPETQLVARGRYLVKVAGCNDCHTAGFAESGGKVPESQWLTGDKLGWHGPWGTTYPANLRLYMTALTQDQWVQVAKSMEPRPPMPWWALRYMNQGDLRALYAYLKWLGPAGEPAPNYVPPDQQPTGPVVRFPAPPRKN